MAALVALGIALLAVAARTLPWPAPGLLAYAGLGLLPGLALAHLVARGWSTGARLTLGLALSPLVATAAAVPLLGAGLDPRTAAIVVVALATAVLMAVELAIRRPAASPAAASTGIDLRGTPDGAFVLWASLALAAAVAIPPLVSRYVLVRGDAWIHAGIAWDIVHHGVPPEDPRFAGLSLNYVWYFNAFVALLVRLSGAGPFLFMALFNVVQAGVTASLAYRLGLAVWRDRSAARGTMVVLVLGFNAAAWLLWPLGLLRAVVGEVRGGAEVLAYLHTVKFPAAAIIDSLGAPDAHMVNFFDKLLTGTSLHHAYALMILYLWVLVSWLHERRAETLLFAAAAAAGMLFFHGVVGLSVLPVALAVLVTLMALRRAWGWLPGTGALAGAAAATAVGGAAALPYTIAISRGWAGEVSGLEHSYLGLGGRMAWTLLTACAFAGWLAWEPARRALASRLPAPAFTLALALGMAAFAVVVDLPGPNETKFVYEAFVPVAVLAGAGLSAARAGWTTRLGRAGAAVLLGIVLLASPLLTIAGYALDPGARTLPELNPRPGEEALYRWIRERTPAGAVFVDRGGRDLIMVRGQRRLYLGTTAAPEKSAFPVAGMNARRRLLEDLYDREQGWDRHRLDLLALARPVFVLFRPEDSIGREPWRPLDADGASTLEYARDGYRVYRAAAGAAP